MLVQTIFFLRSISAELFSNNQVTCGHLSANVNLKIFTNILHTRKRIIITFSGLKIKTVI